MFGFIESAVNNTLNIASGILDGELPTQKQVVKLASDGLSVYAISEATGLAVNVIEGFLD